MSQETNIQQEALKWISPIMHFGSDLEDKVYSEDEEKLSAEPTILALSEGLTKEERAIFFSNRLSSQIGLQGLNLFFEYTVGIYYYEILDALHEIGSSDMAEALKSCKEVVFGDADVPVDDFEKLDEMVYADGMEERAEQLEMIADEAEKSGGVCEFFYRRLNEYVMECVARGALTKKYD